MIDELWKNVVAETIFSPLVLNPWWPTLGHWPMRDEKEYFWGRVSKQPNTTAISLNWTRNQSGIHDMTNRFPSLEVYLVYKICDEESNAYILIKDAWMKNPTPIFWLRTLGWRIKRLYFDKGRLDEGSSAYIFIKDAWMKDPALIIW